MTRHLAAGRMVQGYLYYDPEIAGGRGQEGDRGSQEQSSSRSTIAEPNFIVQG